MMINIDTIAAVSTPRGEGGIAIVRMSGPLAIPIAEIIFRSPSKTPLSRGGEALSSQVKTHTQTYGHIIDPETEQVIDEVLVCVMKAPRTYTTEDIVEINCHGGAVCVQRVLELTLRKGARLAQEGEFTKRAFLNGRIDLAQAEAVADIIYAKTDLSRRVAMNQLTGKLSGEINQLRDELVDILAEVEASIDFPDEDVDTADAVELREHTTEILNKLADLLNTADEGIILRDGLNLVIVGKPNVGKSSLLNALLQKDRAIVTEIPGTTRDTIEEYANIKGIPIKLIDTAGIRSTEDIIEEAGVQRSKARLEEADLSLLMLDASNPLTENDRLLFELTRDKKTIIILNKIDLAEVISSTQIKDIAPDKPSLRTSMLTGEGLDNLKTTIRDAVIHGGGISPDSVIVTNTRHRDAMRNAKIDLQLALDSMNGDMPPELIAIDLKGALDKLGIIVGKTSTDDILERIFSKFCIGK